MMRDLVVGDLLCSKGDHAGLGAGDHGFVVPRIGIGQGKSWGAEAIEQGFLGGDVAVEITVIIEVVVGDVGEDTALRAWCLPSGADAGRGNWLP